MYSNPLLRKKELEEQLKKNKPPYIHVSVRGPNGFGNLIIDFEDLSLSEELRVTYIENTYFSVEGCYNVDEVRALEIFLRETKDLLQKIGVIE